MPPQPALSARQGIQPSFENQSRCHAVDIRFFDRASTLASLSQLTQFLLRFERRVSLIDPMYGQRQSLLYLGRESLHQIAERVPRAIRIIRLTDDDLLCAHSAHEFCKRLPFWLEPFPGARPFEGPQRSCAPRQGVTHGATDAT